MAYETAIIRFLVKHPELRRSEWTQAVDPLAGHCYVASEAFYYLNGGAKKWTPQVILHEGASHWFLVSRETGKIVDLTSIQFRTPVPYDRARGIGFLTKKPSKRARKVINAVRR